MDRPMLRILKGLWKHISYLRRRQFGLVIFIAILASFAEVVSLGAVLPFVGVLTQPDEILAYPLVSEIARCLNINSGSELVLPLTLSFALAALIAGFLRLLLLWVTLNLGNKTGADLSIEVYRRTLYQPYETHIQRSSSEIISGITQKVGVATSVLISIVTVVTSLLLFVSILVALIAVDPLIAFFSAISFGAAYGFIAWLSRKKLFKNSSIMAYQQSRVVKALQEGLGAIRDVLLDGTQNVYVDFYGKAVVRLRRAGAENGFISQAPRFAMETLGLVLISFFVLMLSDRPGGIAGGIPILAAIALGAQRLLPLMQMIYGNWALIAGSKVGLIDVLNLLEQSMPSYAAEEKLKSLELKKDVCLENIYYSYGDDSTLVLKNLTYTVKKGSRVGIIGDTGSGKSTTLDLLMGLLEPNEGQLKVDGVPLVSDKQRSSWQRSVAHVPQSIFLSDASIAENIAFGIEPDKIDFQKVRSSAKRAQIDEFIESRPEGYHAFVGERGVRLSGGQRQRIGIARALYHNPQVLILDEATSALDEYTEQAVMDAVNKLSKNITIILIAHRLNTVKDCDIIFKFHKGKVISQGKFNDVVKSK